MKKLIAIIAFLTVVSASKAQTYVTVGNTLQRAPTSLGWMYRFNMGVPGFMQLYTKQQVDSLINHAGLGYVPYTGASHDVDLVSTGKGLYAEFSEIGHGSATGNNLYGGYFYNNSPTGFGVKIEGGDATHRALYIGDYTGSGTPTASIFGDGHAIFNGSITSSGNTVETTNNKTSTISNSTSTYPNWYGLTHYAYPKTHVDSLFAGLIPLKDIYSMTFGQEYLGFIHNKALAKTDTLKIIWSGDSTTDTVGHYVSPGYAIDSLFWQSANIAGLHKLKTINRGHTGIDSQMWLDTYLASDLAENPDLYIIRIGLNDPYFGGTPATFETNLRAAITIIRNAKSQKRQSILLMVPNTANDVLHGRDSAYLEAITPIIKKAARDFQCGFIDTYHLWRDSGHGIQGLAMDSTGVAPGVAVHPKNVFNTWINSVVFDFVMPKSLLNKIYDNPTSPTGALFAGNIGLNVPNADVYGIGSAHTYLSLKSATASSRLSLSGYSGGAIEFGSNTGKRQAGFNNQEADLVFYNNTTNTGTSLTEGMRLSQAHNLSVVGSIYQGANQVANDNAVVHISGDETINGAKTFTGTVSFDDGSGPRLYWQPDGQFALQNGAEFLENGFPTTTTPDYIYGMVNVGGNGRMRRILPSYFATSAQRVADSILNAATYEKLANKKTTFTNSATDYPATSLFAFPSNQILRGTGTGITSDTTNVFNGSLGVGRQPEANNGTVLNVYNKANTGTVASNAAVISESVNRNSNFIARIPRTGAGGIQVQKNTRDTTYMQLTGFPNNGNSYADLSGGAIANAAIRLFGGGTNKLLILGPTSVTNPTSAGLSSSYPIGISGNMLPMTDNTYILGSSSFRLNNIYATSATFTSTNITETYSNLSPSSVSFPHIMTATGLGDNTNFKGVGALQLNVQDDASVVTGTKGVLYGLNINVKPLLSRNNSPNDDAVGLVMSNGTTNSSKATEMIYGAKNSAFTSGAFEASNFIANDMNADNLFKSSATHTYGFNLSSATINTGVIYGKNNITWLLGRNAANSADIALVKTDASDNLAFQNSNVTFSSAGAGTFASTLKASVFYSGITTPGANMPTTAQMYLNNTGSAYGSTYYPEAVFARPNSTATHAGWIGSNSSNDFVLSMDNRPLQIVSEVSGTMTSIATFNQNAAGGGLTLASNTGPNTQGTLTNNAGIPQWYDGSAKQTLAYLASPTFTGTTTIGGSAFNSNVGMNLKGGFGANFYNSGNTFKTNLYNDGTSADYNVALPRGSGTIALTSDIAIKTHNIFTPTTGGTVALVNNQYNIINPTGSLVTLTVNLPSSPANNDVVYIKYTQSITTVTYGNGTVVDGITSPVAGGLVILVFDSGSNSWY